MRAYHLRSGDLSARMFNAFAVIAGLGIIFQIGHFAEHLVQFLVWLTGNIQWVVVNFCGRDTPFMSAPVANFAGALGARLFPEADIVRQNMVGVEVLHLIGNGIFLAGIAALYCVLPVKLVRWALIVEGLHLCEHILLTASVLFIGKPIGVSTLLGYAPSLLGREYAVGYRVSWHFVMNLAPLPFIMFALMRAWFGPAARAA